MERHPKLNVLLVHGGGFVPYQAGRWAHGWHVRPEPKVNVKQVAGAVDRPVLLRHHPAREAAARIPGRVGRAPSRVLLGSDYPYDMGTGECVRQVDALWIDDADKAAILNGNAVTLLGVRA